MDDTLPAAGQSQSLLLPGAAGNIEVLLAAPRGTPRGVAVICHPHPLMGGALSNKVTYTLASSALKADLYALRFNFRGVGQSQGEHDLGRGESDDVVYLAGWLRARAPGLPLLLAGFSFGSWVALNAAARLRPQALISIAPPLSKYLGDKFFGDAPPPPRPACPWLVVHGTDDDVVDYAQTRDMLQQYTPPPELRTLDGAGHFFHGRLVELGELVLPFIQSEFGH